jgi:hypothetical protein
MSNFLADKVKKTITLKELQYSQVKNRDRHHLAFASSKYEVGDVIVLQSESNEMMNARHPNSAINIWALITTKEVFPAGENLLCIYGFTSLEDMPRKLLDIANSIYQANCELVDFKVSAMQKGIEMS